MSLAATKQRCRPLYGQRSREKKIYNSLLMCILSTKFALGCTFCDNVCKKLEGTNCKWIRFRGLWKESLKSGDRTNQIPTTFETPHKQTRVSLTKLTSFMHGALRVQICARKVATFSELPRCFPHSLQTSALIYRFTSKHVSSNTTFSN